MLETLHRVGSKIRNAPALRRQEWLWRRVEPTWNYVFSRLTTGRGYTAHINGETFALTYGFASRYDRADQRVYESVFYGAFADEIREGMTVIDIGAHIGFFTLAAARRVGPTGRVFSFEPTPVTAKILADHVALNHWTDRVSIVREVVSDADGFATFYARGDFPTMAASLARFNVEEAIKIEPGPSPESMKIRSTTIDSFCRTAHVKPDVIKIDAEGAEFKILLGAENLLRERKVKILCEIHPYLIEKLGANLDSLHAYLVSLNYTMRRIDDPNPLGIFHAVIAPEPSQSTETTARMPY